MRSLLSIIHYFYHRLSNFVGRRDQLQRVHHLMTVVGTSFSACTARFIERDADVAVPMAVTFIPNLAR